MDNEKIFKNKIAFDIDGTLLNTKDNPNYWVIDLLLWFNKIGWDIIVWSGGGIDYTRTMVYRLGLEDIVRIIPKASERVDIAVDDMMDGNYNLSDKI